jgi:hypothetical protein
VIVIVGFVDIGGKVDHQLKFSFDNMAMSVHTIQWT